MNIQSAHPLTLVDTQVIREGFSYFLDHCEWRVDSLFEQLRVVLKDSFETMSNKDKMYWLFTDFFNQDTGCDKDRVNFIKLQLINLKQNELASLLPSSDILPADKMRIIGETPIKLSTSSTGPVICQSGSQHKSFMEKLISAIHDKKTTGYYNFLSLLKKKNGEDYSEVSQLTLKDKLSLFDHIMDQGNYRLLNIVVYMAWFENGGREKGEGSILRESILKYKTFNSENRVRLDTIWWEKSLTKLMKAARSGDEDAVIKIINDKSESEKLECKDTKKVNALYWAVVGGNRTVLQKLLDARLDPTVKTTQEETLLHIACRLGHSDMIELLAKCTRVDGMMRDDQNKTAFDLCAESGNLATFVELIKHFEYVPYSVPVWAATFGQKRFLKYCVDELKMPVNSKDQLNKTPLHGAIEGGHEEIVKYLLEKEASTTSCTSSGENVLHLACRSGHEGILEILIEKIAQQHEKLLISMMNEKDHYFGDQNLKEVSFKEPNCRIKRHYVIEVTRYWYPQFMKKVKEGSSKLQCYGKVLTEGGYGGEMPMAKAKQFKREIYKKRTSRE